MTDEKILFQLSVVQNDLSSQCDEEAPANTDPLIERRLACWVISRLYQDEGLEVATGDRRQEAGGEVINPSANDPAIIAATTCATSQPPPPAMPPDNPDTDNNQNFTPDLGTIQYLYIFIRFVSPAHTNM